MIFCSKNEKGEFAWKLIQEYRKTVTRRLKPIEPGKIVAVQPNRCKKAVGYIKIKSCKSYEEWIEPMENKRAFSLLDIEAHKEGFESWDGLRKWFFEHKINITNTFRIEFIYIGETKPFCISEDFRCL